MHSAESIDGDSRLSGSRPLRSAAVSNASTRVVAYHEILPQPAAYKYHVSVARLREHLDAFRGMAEHAASTSRILVTFDDGHLSHVAHAAEVLAEFKMQAVFFVLAGPAGRLANGLSWAQVRELAAMGHRIESHGWAHRLLPSCSVRELLEELRDSRLEIEQQIGAPVGAISAPGGRWNRSVLEAAAAAGYDEFFHSNPWVMPTQRGSIIVRGRLMVEQQHAATAIARLLDPSPRQRWMRGVVNGAKETLRRSIGDRAYHWAWCRLAHFQPADGLTVQVPSTRQDSST